MIPLSKYTEEQRRKRREANNRWRSRNREKLNTSRRAYMKSWRSRNPGYKSPAQCEWEKTNIARIRQLQRQWTSRNLPKMAEKTRRRSALKRSQVCDCCKPADLQPLYERARRLGMHVDHVRPLAKGGRHCLRNLQLLSPTENLRKSAKYREAS